MFKNSRSCWGKRSSLRLFPAWPALVRLPAACTGWAADCPMYQWLPPSQRVSRKKTEKEPAERPWDPQKLRLSLARSPLHPPPLP